MKIIVTGGRDYTNREQVRRILTLFSPDILCVGDCPTGLDSFAKEWAEDEWNFAKLDEYKADWEKFKRAAGPIRNKEMVDKNRDADLVIAFPGGDGTADCMRHAKAAGLIVFKVVE